MGVSGLRFYSGSMLAKGGFYKSGCLYGDGWLFFKPDNPKALKPEDFRALAYDLNHPVRRLRKSRY
jgi:hypothetical protein